MRSARRLVLIGLVVAGGCGGGAAHARKPAVPAPAKPPELAPVDVVTAVRGAIEQYREAFEVHSVDGMAPLYAHGPEVEILDQGQRYRGWTAVRNYLRDQLAQAKQAELKFDDLVVVALGGRGAAATARFTRTVSDGVTSVTVHGVLSIALRRHGTSWRIVQEHFSYASPAQ